MLVHLRADAVELVLDEPGLVRQLGIVRLIRNRRRQHEGDRCAVTHGDIGKRSGARRQRERARVAHRARRRSHRRCLHLERPRDRVQHETSAQPDAQVAGQHLHDVARLEFRLARCQQPLARAQTARRRRLAGEVRDLVQPRRERRRRQRLTKQPEVEGRTRQRPERGAQIAARAVRASEFLVAHAPDRACRGHDRAAAYRDLAAFVRKRVAREEARGRGEIGVVERTQFKAMLSSVLLVCRNPAVSPTHWYPVAVFTPAGESTRFEEFRGLLVTPPSVDDNRQSPYCECERNKEHCCELNLVVRSHHPGREPEERVEADGSEGDQQHPTPSTAWSLLCGCRTHHRANNTAPCDRYVSSDEKR